MQYIELPVHPQEDEDGTMWFFDRAPDRQFVIDWRDPDREDTLIYASKFSVSGAALFWVEGSWTGQRVGDKYATTVGPDKTYLVAAVPDRRWNKITERPTR